MYRNLDRVLRLRQKRPELIPIAKAAWNDEPKRQTNQQQSHA